MTKTTPHAEKLEFKTELKQLLHIITHSLYSNKEIFLRELISNASDAINKLKFDSLQHEEKLEGDKDWKIKIAVDKEKNTLTVSDNGIGLSRDLAVENLGTIAKSGTRAFLESLQSKERPELIGQFGVGFYSAFMVADRVTVVSRLAGDPPDQGVRWESDGQGDFTVESVRKDRRGTDVTLHLKADEKEFLDPYNVRQIVKRFSDFIEHPVVMDVEKEEKGEKSVVEETINARRRCGCAASRRSRRRSTRSSTSRSPTTTRSRPASSTTRRRAPTSSACWSSSRRTGRSSCNGATSRPGCGFTSSASSSWSAARSCCRRTCASCAASSIRPTCRSTSRANCSNTTPFWRRSRRTSCGASSTTWRT